MSTWQLFAIALIVGGTLNLVVPHAQRLMDAIIERKYLR